MSIIGMKIFLGQNLLLVLFFFGFNISNLEVSYKLKYFWDKMYCLFLFGYDNNKLEKNVWCCVWEFL